MNVSDLIEEYRNGSSLTALAKKNNRDARTIRKILVKQGEHIRSKEEQNKYSPQNQRKYHIDDTFLDKIDSCDKAYLIGFIAADGTIQPDGSIKIALSTKDKELLIKFQAILETNYPIRDSITKDGYEVSTFVFRSKSIRERLFEYNVVRGKTYFFSFPKTLPKKYYIDFIRGYWDGDGTICLINGCPRSSLCSYQKDFLKDVIDILFEQYGIQKVKLYKQKESNTWYFQYSELASYKLYSAFYEGKENRKLFLARKYSKFVELFGEINSHEPAASQAEDNIV